MQSMISEKKLNFINTLKRELENRKKLNDAYSLRSFARFLKIPASTLSEVLRGNRGLNSRQAVSIAERLFSSSDQKKEFVFSALGINIPLQENKKNFDRYELWPEKRFEIIAEWHYFAILNLAKLLVNSCNPRWLSKKLGITAETAYQAFERLLRMRLIKFKNDGFIRTSNPIFMDPKNSSQSAMEFHRQMIDKARDSLCQIPRSSRDISCITVATSRQKIEAAREKIKAFREELAVFLEESTEKEDVYQLNLQFFPLTKGE